MHARRVAVSNLLCVDKLRIANAGGRVSTSGYRSGCTDLDLRWSVLFRRRAVKLADYPLLAIACLQPSLPNAVVLGINRERQRKAQHEYPWGRLVSDPHIVPASTGLVLIDLQNVITGMPSSSNRAAATSRRSCSAALRRISASNPPSAPHTTSAPRHLRQRRDDDAPRRSAPIRNDRHLPAHGPRALDGRAVGRSSGLSDPPVTAPPRSERVADLSVALLGPLITILDSTVVNVALTTIGHDLNAALMSTQGVSTGYLLRSC